MTLGTRVAITGGTGSLGCGLVRALADSAERLVILSRHEALQAAMAGRFRQTCLRFFLADVRDRERLEQAFSGIDVVIHAAALKRVDSTSRDVRELVLTNIVGTLNVLAAARASHVRMVVVTSSDKAVHPTNAYGASKLMAEFLTIQSNNYSPRGMRSCVTRYGNVLGSTGAVIHRWRAEKHESSPLTITNPMGTRFWMTMDQAVALVLMAASDARGGEIFVPKLKAMPVVDVADCVAPGHPHRLVPLRPGGEKIHESLMTFPESARAIDRGSYWVIPPELHEWTSEPWPEPSRPQGWHYRSDLADSFTRGEMTAILSCTPP